MSDNEAIDIRKISAQIRELLFLVIEKNYLLDQNADSSSSSPLNIALKKKAEGEIDGLRASVIYKFELITYILTTIKTFNWDVFHNFKYYYDQSINEIEKSLNFKKVKQDLHSKKLIVLCENRETMEHFIFTNVVMFFSTVSGILDNISLMMKIAFRLNIKGDAVIKVVYSKLQECLLKEFLYEFADKNYSFWGMRDIRNACLHHNITEVFPYAKRAALGGGDLGLPHINLEIVSTEIKEEDSRIDVYCDFLYGKLSYFIQDFSIALSKTALQESKEKQ